MAANSPNQKPKQSPQKKTPSTSGNGFTKYSTMAVKMAAIIVGFTFGGRYLDGLTTMEFPVFTLILVLLSVFLAMWVMIRDIQK